MAEKNSLYQYLLLLGDNSMILGQRLAEICGHGPELETDIAITNISLDLFGQVRNYFQYAADVIGDGRTEDDIAMLRYENEYRNSLLVEQPNTDFAYLIARQFYYDHYHHHLLNELLKSKDAQIAAIAMKSIKEVNYHVDFSSAWLRRLGDGTEESKQKMQNAIDYLWPYAMGLFEETQVEKEMKSEGVGANLPVMKEIYLNRISESIADATLETPKAPTYQYGGKNGIHSEHMGYILSDFQFMQRSFPNMKW